MPFNINTLAEGRMASAKVRKEAADEFARETVMKISDILIHEWDASGRGAWPELSLNEIARRLNASGYPGPSGKRETWTARAVKNAQDRHAALVKEWRDKALSRKMEDMEFKYQDEQGRVQYRRPSDFLHSRTPKDAEEQRQANIAYIAKHASVSLEEAAAIHERTLKSHTEEMADSRFKTPEAVFAHYDRWFADENRKRKERNLNPLTFEEYCFIYVEDPLYPWLQKYDDPARYESDMRKWRRADLLRRRKLNGTLKPVRRW
jgi:hypothetical protein